MIAITGATGQLGRLVIDALLHKGVPAASLIAIVRDPARASTLTNQGVTVRYGDYSAAETLDTAMAGVESLLLISANEIGKRTEQHGNVVAAAVRCGVKRLVYTSLLHADRSPLSLASEHLATEALIRASGIPFVVLRNGWYTENYTASIPSALSLGAVYGCAGEGKISSAARVDYAEAAAVALTGAVATGTTCELAGDGAYTLAELAAELSRQAGRPIPYHNLAEADYAAALRKAGLPDSLSAAIASWDSGAAAGALFDNDGQLSRLIGRATTPLADSVRAALKA